MPELRQYRPPTTAGEGQALPPKPYTWRGDLPAHPEAPIPLCGDCGFLVTSRTHHFTCEWPDAIAAASNNRGNPA